MKTFLLIAKYAIFTISIVGVVYSYNTKNQWLLLISIVVVIIFLVKQMWVCNQYPKRLC